MRVSFSSRRYDVPMRRLLAIVLLGSACGEPETENGRSDTLRWHLIEGLTRPSPELLLGAEDILGFELVETDTLAGSVSLFLEERQEDEPEVNYSGGWSCTPFIYLDTHHPVVLAHELGHAYGLEHNDIAGNLMGPARGPLPRTDLTEDQTDTIREHAWLSEEYCLPPP